jgi:hypothetical protein
MSQSLEPMVKKNAWTFQARFRAKAYGWKGSSLAIKRLKEAVTEIKKAARTDAVRAADGAVTLFERFWPSLEQIDTSSGALGNAVHWTQEELIPLVITAPADRKTRDKWLHRLWQAIQDDGVDYLSVVEDHWGELCASPEVASHWADQLVDLIRMSWSDLRSGGSVTGTSLCFSSLLAAGRHEDIWNLLDVARFPFWPYRKFGVDAFVKEGRIEDALAYAESSRWRDQPEPAIDAACERILLECGRSEEAYARYAMKANQAATGVATFRAIERKYPGRDPATILVDLVQGSGDPGRFFAAAKDAGLYDLAFRFAKGGRTDPRTLSRAARDLVDKDAEFAMQVGRLGLERFLQGYGYEVTFADVLDACKHFLVAAQRCGAGEPAAREANALTELYRSKLPNLLADALLRRIRDVALIDRSH